MTDLPVRYGAILDLRDSQGWTPLFWASLKGNLQIAKFLIEQQADYLVVDVHGWTALHWAVLRGDKEMVNALVTHHAEVIQRKDRVELPIKSLTVDEARHLCPTRSVPIELAAKGDDIEIFDLLLQNMPTKKTSGSTKGVFNRVWPQNRFDPPCRMFGEFGTKQSASMGQKAISTARYVRVLRCKTGD
jgi:hypothetical protein